MLVPPDMPAKRSPAPRRRFHRLALLAVAGLAAAVALARRAARTRRGAQQRFQLPVEVGALDFERFDRLCTAYYEARHFRVKPIRWRTDARDAELYFGTLPAPVALLRCVVPGGNPTDVEAISDLAAMASDRGISKAIVHAAGGYTHRAIAFAQLNRTRLVCGEDMAQNIAGMPEPARLALARALDADASAQGKLFQLH